jgi:AraC family transcriptional activator of pobA
MNRHSRRSSIPAFALYGELKRPMLDSLHTEPIQSRSRLHHWEIAPHTHHGLHQILWVASGPAEIFLDDTREECQGPVAIVVPPNTVHAFRFSRETDGHVLTFNPRAIIEGEGPAAGESLRTLFAAPRVLHFDPGTRASRGVAGLLIDLAEEFASPDAVGSPVTLWLARALIWRLAQYGRCKVGNAGRRVRSLFTRFMVLVEAHHRDHWPVSRYANRLGLTPERLNRLTRAETGLGALDLIQERLAREACRRLTYIAAPISKLAFELGFQDPAYFCRFVKRRTGLSPREHRRQTSLSDQTIEVGVRVAIGRKTGVSQSHLAGACRPRVCKNSRQLH